MKKITFLVALTTPWLLSAAPSYAELCGFLDTSLEEIAQQARTAPADRKMIRRDTLVQHVTQYAQEYIKTVKVPVTLLQQDLQDEVQCACKAVIATVGNRITNTRATSIASDDLQVIVERAVERAIGPRFRMIKQQDMPDLVNREIDALIDELGVPHKFITQGVQREIARTKDKIIKILKECIKKTRRTVCSYAEINTLTQDRSRALVKLLEYRLKWHIFQVEQARMIKPTDQLKTRVATEPMEASELRNLYALVKQLEVVKF